MEIIPDRLRSFGDDWGIEEFYTDYQDVPEQEKLHVVSICTTPLAHCAATIDATEAGVRGRF